MSKRKHTTVTQICEVCGILIEVYPCHIKRGQGRFCSYVCRDKWRAVPIRERFSKCLSEATASGCILWTAGKSSKGYGKIWDEVSKTTVAAHRYAYELAYGDIPDGMFVCHHCDTPACVNPVHLFLGDHIANMADMRSKDRHPRGERSGCAKLTDNNIREILRLYATGEFRQVDLGRMFGVSQGNIGKVVRGEQWKHVTSPTS